MKTKIPGLIALIISALSFLLLIGAIVTSITEQPVEEGVSGSFALWIYAVIIAMISLIFYVIDAFFCIGIAIAKRRITMDIVLVLLTAGSIPMVIFVGGALGINVLIWNVYYLVMFVLEMISVVRWVKRK